VVEVVAEDFMEGVVVVAVDFMEGARVLTGDAFTANGAGAVVDLVFVRNDVVNLVPGVKIALSLLGDETFVGGVGLSVDLHKRWSLF